VGQALEKILTHRKEEAASAGTGLVPERQVPHQEPARNANV
jgi:hypothetical protein